MTRQGLLLLAAVAFCGTPHCPAKALDFASNGLSKASRNTVRSSKWEMPDDWELSLPPTLTHDARPPGNPSQYIANNRLRFLELNSEQNTKLLGRLSLLLHRITMEREIGVDGDGDLERIGTEPKAYKRQASSGAQICIWKVCPPTPWRRTRK